MIRLITATPGSGKTCLVVEWLLKEVDKGFYKSIYHNINDLKITGLLPLLEDWRKVPEELKPALIIVDEAQYHHAFMKETTKDNQIGKDLSTHRHYGVDFWLITQSPKLLNPYVIENTGEHVHLYRPKKAKTVTVYWWSYAVTNLTKSNFKQADDVQKWRLNPNMFQYYKSTVAVTDGKGRISQRNVSAVITFCIIMGVIVYFIKQGSNSFEAMQHKDDKVMGIDKNQMPDQKNKQSQQSQQPQQTASASTDLSVECRKGVNVEKPECIKWFDDLSKNKSSVDDKGVIAVSYDSSKPYEFKPEPQIQIRDYPRLSGCAKDTKGRLKGFDQQGNIMINVSQNDCKRWLNGERLFDYTKAPQQVQNNAQLNNQSNSTNTVQQTSQSYIPKQTEIANNDVQPHLQAQVVS